jgi:hypothetical protein
MKTILHFQCIKVLSKEIDLDFVPVAGMALTLHGCGFDILNIVYNPELKIMSCCLKINSIDPDTDIKHPIVFKEEAEKAQKYFLENGWRVFE